VFVVITPGGTRNDDLLTGVVHALDEIPAPGKGLNRGQKLLFEKCRSVRDHFLSNRRVLVDTGKPGKQLVAALTDEGADHLEGDIVAEALQGFESRSSMCFVTVDQCSIHVQYDAADTFRHISSSLFEPVKSSKMLANARRNP